MHIFNYYEIKILICNYSVINLIISTENTAEDNANMLPLQNILEIYNKKKEESKVLIKKKKKKKKAK